MIGVSSIALLYYVNHAKSPMFSLYTSRRCIALAAIQPTCPAGY